MKEYIEREAVIEAIKNHKCKSKVVYSIAEVVYCVGQEIGEAIRSVPAADVVEVRHGKNLSEDDPSRFKCSECGWTCWDTYCGDTITYSFCPNCGAKMDKEE